MAFGTCITAYKPPVPRLCLPKKLAMLGLNETHVPSVPLRFPFGQRRMCADVISRLPCDHQNGLKELINVVQQRVLYLERSLVVSKSVEVVQGYSGYFIIAIL